MQHKWVIGFMDEVWWSRFALPGLAVWSERTRPGRIVEQSRARADADAQALACYGLWWAQADQMLLRFVTGRPVSQVTTAFLDWACNELVRQGQRVWVLIGDNASWHVSAEVRRWIAEHNATAKRTGQGMRILVAGLPVKSPWLNKIEPKWQHGKRAIVEMDGTLSAAELEERVCAYFRAARQPRLVQQLPPEEVAKACRGRSKPSPSVQRPAQEAQTQQAA